MARADSDPYPSAASNVILQQFADTNAKPSSAADSMFPRFNEQPPTLTNNIAQADPSLSFAQTQSSMVPPGPPSMSPRAPTRAVPLYASSPSAYYYNNPAQPVDREQPTQTMDAYRENGENFLYPSAQVAQNPAYPFAGSMVEVRQRGADEQQQQQQFEQLADQMQMANEQQQQQQDQQLALERAAEIPFPI